MSPAALLLPEQLHALALAFGEEIAYQLVAGSSLTLAQWDADASRLARVLSQLAAR